MQMYNIRDAKTHLSRLVEKAAKGESSSLPKRVSRRSRFTALDSPKPARMKRFGFMAGQIKVPRDFNTMGARKIQRLFEGKK